MLKVNGKIVLASASPRRENLLKSLGLEFDIVPPSVEERMREGETPLEFSIRAAREKAMEVLERSVRDDDFWIISADTIVVCQGKVLIKPKDSDEARDMLFLLSGKIHKVITSFCILNPRSKREKLQSVESFVTFRKMSPMEIEWYVKTGEPLDKAGAYGAQGYGVIFIESIEGSYSNVVGLPLSQLVKTLLDVGAVSLWNQQ